MRNNKINPLNVKKTRTKSANKPIECKNTQIKNSSSSLKKTKSALKKTDDINTLNDNSKKTFGMSYDVAGTFLLRQVISCMPEEIYNDEKCMEIAMTMLLDIKPKDELEGMLAAQMIAVHVTSMNMSSRSMTKGQSREGINSYVNNMAKLMRTYTIQLDALKKYRSKCNQTIQVQHVQVNDGGQAVVGNVHGGGGNG